MQEMDLKLRAEAGIKPLEVSRTSNFSGRFFNKHEFK